VIVEERPLLPGRALIDDALFRVAVTVAELRLSSRPSRTALVEGRRWAEL
jgi:hypothetical protein